MKCEGELIKLGYERRTKKTSESPTEIEPPPENRATRTFEEPVI